MHKYIQNLLKNQNNIFKGQFVNNIIKVATGTGLSYLILFISTPILSRIYSPLEFGVMGVYYATVLIAGVIATGRYELAIPVPVEDDVAWALMKLSMVISLIISSLMIFILYFFQLEIFNSLMYCWVLIPAGTFAYTVWMTTELWLNRHGKFTWATISKVIGALIMILSQLLLSKSDYKPIGLVLGLLISFSFSALLNCIMSFKIKPVSTYSIYSAAVIYSNFPKYQLLSQLLNIVINHLPTIVISRTFGSRETGLFSLGTKIMSGFELLATATSQVFFPRAAKNYSEYGNCKEVYNKTFIALLMIALILFPFLFIIMPDIFAIFLGEEWRESGKMMKYLLIMYLFRFVISPLTTLYLISSRQYLFLYKTIIVFILVSLSLLYSSTILNINRLLIFYCISMSIGYLIDGYNTYKLSKGKNIRSINDINSHKNNIESN